MFWFFVLLVIQQPCGINMRDQPQGSSLMKVNITLYKGTPYYCVACRCLDAGIKQVVNCSRLGLYKALNNIENKTTVLDFSFNRIFKLKNSSFDGLTALRELILAQNIISSIETGTFLGLSSLELLDLSVNNFVLLQNVLKPGMFLDLHRLQFLYLQGNVEYLKQTYRGIPEYPIVELKALECLYLDGFLNASFGAEYKNLTKLTNITMSGYLAHCEIEYLSRRSFQNVPSLEYLVLDHCHLKDIEEDKFMHVPNLLYLDISWNFDVGFDTFGKAAYGMKFTKLKELNINGIHNPYRAGSELLRNNMRHFKDLRLEILHMDDNGIEYIDYGVSDMLPRTLRLLTLRKNRLHFGIYLSQFVFDNPSLVVLDAGDQELVVRSDIDLFKSITRKRRRRGVISLNTRLDYSSKLVLDNRRAIFTDREYMIAVTARNGKRPADYQNYLAMFRLHNNYTYHARDKRHISGYENTEIVPLNLETLICSGSRSVLYLLNFSGVPNTITKMDFSRNFIANIHEKAFEGLAKLKYLNLSYNYLEHIHSNGFIGLDRLDTLDLSGNLLGFSIKTDTNSRIFIRFQFLKHLNLSNNRITKIPVSTFKSLAHVVSLNLKNNHIESFEVNLASTRDLTFLDLSDNKIQFLPLDVRAHLDIIAKNHEVSVNLNGNKLLCNCETIKFLEWIVSTNVDLVNIDTYYCSLNNGSIRFLNSTNTLLVQLHKECKSYIEIIVGSTIGITFVIAFILFYATYRNRWKLRYMYYMAKLKLDIKPTDGNEEREYPFDVFISYADGDRHFVIKDLLEELEEKAGFRMLIRDRDYEIGESIAINISKSVRSSKKTVLLLSRHFLKNNWCDFELNMARMESIHARREVILLIFLETIPPNKLPLGIIDLLRSCPNIERPKEINAQHVFWERVATLLRN